MNKENCGRAWYKPFMESVKPSSGKCILIGENLFTPPISDSELTKLVGSYCQFCGETVFPAKKRCPNCGNDNITQTLLGPKGKLYSFTIIYQSPPVGYKGPVPYGVVKVEMPDGPRISGYTSETDPAKLKPGMEMEIVTDTLFVDEEGNEVTGFKFRPVTIGER